MPHIERPKQFDPRAVRERSHLVMCAKARMLQLHLGTRAAANYLYTRHVPLGTALYWLCGSRAWRRLYFNSKVN